MTATKFLLRQGNRDLARSKVFVWSIPALTATLESGKRIKTCPNAGVCGSACYARSGTYRFSNVRKAHTENLRFVDEELDRWEAELIAELTHKRYRDAWVRIHDAGDFYSLDYALAWCRVATSAPDVCFYAYTKEVAMFKELTLPPNFTIIYSTGGLQDRLIDKDKDRHAEVFPDLESLLEAGYSDQAEDDRLAVTGFHKVGIVANNIPKARKRQKQRSFGEWQAERPSDALSD